MTRPTIAITMGDACRRRPGDHHEGLAHAELYELCRPLVIGDAERLRRAGEHRRRSRLAVNADRRCAEARFEHRRGRLHRPEDASPPTCRSGSCRAVAGEAAYRYHRARRSRWSQAGKARRSARRP